MKASVSFIADCCVKYPKFNLIFTLLVTLLIAFQARQVSFDTSMVGFLELDNPHRIAYNTFKDTFGLSEYFVVIIETDEVFEHDFLLELEKLEKSIVDGVHYVANVESVLTAISIKKEGEDNILIEPLFEHGTSSETLKLNRQYALNNHYFKNRLISEDSKTTAIIVELQPYIHSIRNQQFHMLLLDDVMDSYLSLERLIVKAQPNFPGKMSLGGAPAAASELTKATKHDIVVFTGISLFIIAFVMWYFFRSIVAIMSPLIVLVCTAIISLSLMIIGEFPMQITSSMLPSFLLAICVGDAVHLMKHFFRYKQKNMSNDHAIRCAINSTFTAMFFTTLTTSIGLLSFSSSGILPIASFGLFTAIGVWIALILTFLCIPALYVLAPEFSSEQQKGGDAEDQHKKRLDAYVNALSKHAGIVVLVSLLLTGFAIYKTSQLSLSHDSLSWLDEENPVRSAVKIIDEKLNGSLSVEIVIDTKEANGIYSPALLEGLDQFIEEVKQTPIAGITINNSLSLIEPVKDIHSIIRGDDSVIPQTKELLAQEILLLQVDATEKVKKYTDENHQKFRVTLTTEWKDAVLFSDFLLQLEQRLQQRFTDKYEVTVTGMASILNRTITEMIRSMAFSYLLAGIMVTLVMMLLLRSIGFGLIMMLPNFLPILCVMMFMSVFDIPLDMFTLLIGSIAIGLIVDDSVHFSYGVKRYYSHEKNMKKAIAASLYSAGSAMAVTSAILSLGFIVYCFSYLNNLRNFGLLTSLCIILALIADFVVAPALLLFFFKDKEARNG